MDQGHEVGEEKQVKSIVVIKKSNAHQFKLLDVPRVRSDAVYAFLPYVNIQIAFLQSLALRLQSNLTPLCKRPDYGQCPATV